MVLAWAGALGSAAAQPHGVGAAPIVQREPTAGASEPQPAAEADARLAALAQTLERQAQEIERLREALAIQQQSLESARRALEAERMARLPARPVVDAASAGHAAPATPASPQEPDARDEADDPGARHEIQAAAARVAPVAEQPGVLTPRGRVALEASLQYAYASSNRIALVGYTVVPAILVGLIDVREVKRSTYTLALAARVGLGERFELEAKLPWVYRSDTSIGREYDEGASTDSAVFQADGRGLGDIEFSARYQLNAVQVDRPVYVAGLRIKSRSGRDAFEVPTTYDTLGFRNDGLQQRLPTGSGFVGVQPGLTVLLPSDPVVFVGGISYLHHVKRHDVVRQSDRGPELLGTLAPGGVLGFNFGMGLALNERSSFSIGYDHSSIGRVRQNGRAIADSVRLQLGTLLLGYSYRLGDGRSLNLALGAGLTQDTPDLTLTLRLPTAP